MKKILIAIAILIVLTAAGVAIFAWPYLFSKAEKQATIIVTNDDTPLAQLAQAEGEEFCGRVENLLNWFEVDLSQRVAAYNVNEGDSPLDVAKTIRNFSQVGLKVTINNIRTLDQLAQRASNRLMMTDEQLLELLKDPAFCDSLGKTPQTIATLFLPDTYEFYYAVTPRQFVNLFAAYYCKFWNEERLAKAQALGLSPDEVATIASIVEEETAKSDERGKVARLYINRLRIGMKLQADPTVKFAIGDFSLRRINYEHLKIQSPYNTYLVKGLPPGPIRLPEKATLDAVLDAPEHNYIFMCAKEDFSGYHNFSADYSQHLQNARRYQAELNRRGIH